MGTMPTIDKSKWGPGPWQDEPDHVAFEHAGYSCIVHRGPAGGLCGYVAVPPGHPWHGMDYNEVPADVHGGLTYGGKCEGAICHVPKSGEPDNVFWIGFDTAHSGDVSPAFRRLSAAFTDPRDSYKTMAYVTSETKRLAEQACAAVDPVLAEAHGEVDAMLDRDRRPFGWGPIDGEPPLSTVPDGTTFRE